MKASYFFVSWNWMTAFIVSEAQNPHKLYNKNAYVILEADNVIKMFLLLLFYILFVIKILNISDSKILLCFFSNKLEKIFSPNMLIFYFIVWFKILAMRHPRRLVLSGCLAALIVSLLFRILLILNYLLTNLISDFLVKPHITVYFWCCLGNDHSFCCCWLGCSKSGKQNDCCLQISHAYVLLLVIGFCLSFGNRGLTVVSVWLFT